MVMTRSHLHIFDPALSHSGDTGMNGEIRYKSGVKRDDTEQERDDTGMVPYMHALVWICGSFDHLSLTPISIICVTLCLYKGKIVQNEYL